MRIRIYTKISLILGIGVPVIIVGEIILKVGTGNGAIYPLLALFFVPSAIGVSLAWLVRERAALGWIVLFGLVAVAADGLFGLYEAFFRTPARGAQYVIFRSFVQIYIMAAVAGAIGVLMFACKLKRPRSDTNLR